jgi:hypothetical protein
MQHAHMHESCEKTHTILIRNVEQARPIGMFKYRKEDIIQTVPTGISRRFGLD